MGLILGDIGGQAESPSPLCSLRCGGDTFGAKERGSEMLAVLAVTSVCLVAPVDGPIMSRYAPVGEYAGHWGVDFAAEVGEAVRSPASGLVTFAGSVAGMMTVTIEPVPGFKVSVSYLAEIGVGKGQRVERGQVIARAGSPHGRPGVHLSTRLGGTYVDPVTRLDCVETDITRALRLMTPPRPYPRSRANRDPRGDFRPHPHRPSPRGANGDASRRARSGVDHARRRSMAEVRPPGQLRSPSIGDGEAGRRRRRGSRGRRS